MSSKSKASEPLLPLISIVMWFLRPRAKRVASRFASAPFLNRPIHETASSTVTLPIFCRSSVEAAPARSCERTLLDEGLHEAADFLEFADEVTAEVDDVRVDVAVRAGAGDLC